MRTFDEDALENLFPNFEQNPPGTDFHKDCAEAYKMKKMFVPDEREMLLINGANSKGPSTKPCGTLMLVGRNYYLVVLVAFMLFHSAF